MISLLGCAPLMAAAQGFNFRPMDGAEPPSKPLAPGWRVDSLPPEPQGAKSAQPNDFRFQPQQQRPSVVPSPAEGRPANAMHYNFAPDEQSATSAPPPPLPDPVKSNALMAPPMGFADPQQPMAAQIPHGFQSTHPAGVPPSPLPPPLRLEGRYIDGPHSHVDQNFPFRPMDDERAPTAKTRSTQSDSQPDSQAIGGYGRGSTNQPQAAGMVYPPPAPGYGPRRYDRYNNGPSFNGIRFPFNNGSFPFSFR